jgi:hypothetical protein
MERGVQMLQMNKNTEGRGMERELIWVGFFIRVREKEVE